MTNFERFAPAIATFYIGMAGVAVAFGSVVLRGGAPVTPELYGPAVYAIPALAWVAVQLLGSLMAAAGAIKGGYLGAWICVAGSAVSTVLHATFAVLSQMAEHGTLLSAGSVFLTTPLSAASGMIALRYALRGIHGRQ